MVSDRIEYIDGIRGIAILLVFLAHLSSGVYPSDIPFSKEFSFLGGGGLMGVQLFFALSGYLITQNLIRELEKHGNIDFRLFYLRRFWRLYPVLISVSIAYLGYVLFFMDTRLALAAFGDVFMALTYTSNLPVFPEWFPDMNWMSHTWSLAVEEQFYLIWPLVLWLTLKSDSKRLVVLVTSLIIIATILMRFYYPSFSYGILRWDAIMLGCLLNFFQITHNKIIVFLSVSVICIYSWKLPEPIKNSDYLITSIVAFAFISQSKFLWFLNSKPLVYFGKISYSLYLWHFFFMRLGYSGWLNLSVSLILSDISYRFFELPILNWAKLRFQLIR